MKKNTQKNQSSQSCLLLGFSRSTHPPSCMLLAYKKKLLIILDDPLGIVLVQGVKRVIEFMSSSIIDVPALTFLLTFWDALVPT